MADRLVVNTNRLTDYANRLTSAIGRINTLQSRIRTLYRTDEVSGIWYFYQYNRFYAGTQKLARCRSYITNTVSDLEIVERFFTEADPLNFVAPSGSLIAAVNSKTDTTKTELGIVKALLKGGKKAISKSGTDGPISADDLGLASDVVSYVSSLYTFFTAESTDIGDVLDLSKASGDMWTGLYEFAEKSLSAKEAAKLGKRFQKSAGIVSLAGNLLGLTSDVMDSIDALKNDDNIESHEISEELFKLIGSGSGVAQSVVDLKYGQKVLSRTVTAKYQWAPTAKNAKVLDKASTVISLVEVTADTLGAGANAYGRVTADGHLDMGDMGEIGVVAGVKGLTTIAGKATFGLTDALGLPDKANDISEGMLDFVDTKGVDYVLSHDISSAYVQATKTAQDYANNENNNIVGRVTVSAVLGTGMIVSVAADGVCDGFNWIGDKVSSGWNSLKLCFT